MTVRLRYISALVLWLLALPLVAGCQALGGEDSVATIEVDLTMYAAEHDAIQGAADAEQTMAAATLAAAGNAVAELAVVNAALGATLRANYTPTPAVRPAVVSAEDMGSSLDEVMMDEAEPAEAAMRVLDLAPARGVDANSGCSSGVVQQFNTDAEQIYVTARVTGLQAGTSFDVDWLFEDRVVYRVSWQADYSKSVECIWFYAGPVDFPFLPGSYTATLYVNGLPIGSTVFTIASV